MNTVSICASKSYEVMIGPGLLDNLGQWVAEPGVQTAAIISDSHVWPLYGERAMKSLHDAGLRCVRFVFPAGEASKNGETFLQIVNFLAENHLTRTDRVVALGGGVVGDVAGFAAACCMRGIPCVQVPTTLLAAVDSSVGGKTAIDLPAGKNLCGVFSQPHRVICDMDTLTTLPERIFRDGCAEVIKYGILYDEALFSTLERDGLNLDREAVNTRCVQLKRDVVAADEYDTGARMKLNLGHTFGHALEAASNFALSHGQAVAAGMAIAARACGCRDTKRIISLLQAFQLPTGTDFPVETLAQLMLSDKKRAGDTIRLILPEAIGDCRIVPVATAQLQKLLEKGL